MMFRLGSTFGVILLAMTLLGGQDSFARGEKGYQLDGFQLGDLYLSQIAIRSPYDQICDSDPIDEKSKQVIIYAGLPCRGKTFPEGTSVIFFTDYAESFQDLNVPIQTIVWMGGSYFSSRSDFPLQTGSPADLASATLGEPIDTISFSKRGRTLLVQKHEENVYSMIEDETLVGFILGEMPEDYRKEQWRVILSVYGKLTPR